jgi:hypothetical protein
MTSTLSSPGSIAHRATRRNARAPHTDRARLRQERGTRGGRRVLGRYTDRQGQRREIVAQPGLAGSMLVVDRDVPHHGDRRLVAHLAADEPAENAAVVCESYLQDAPRGGSRCRRLTLEDSITEPFPDASDAESLAPTAAEADPEPFDRLGRGYRLELLQTGMSIPELRWRQHPAAASASGARPVSVREAIACLEDYEPVRTSTIRALVGHRGAADVSTTVLRAELARLQDSPIVLNRKLRGIVLATIEREGLSMSEIAIRCGRVKRDARGSESGETSWLARRLGILPEGGREMPTPWIHSDVLGLISRQGLGISPREVELG